MIEDLFNKSIWSIFFRSKEKRKNNISDSSVTDITNVNDNNTDDDDDDYIYELHENFNGLDIEFTIKSHLQWKLKLEKAVEKHSIEEYTLSSVAADDNCALGKWIYSKAKEFYANCEHSDIYTTLKKSHAKFHKIAAEILNDVNNGEIELAKMKIKREFARCSDAVQLDLLRLCIATI